MKDGQTKIASFKRSIHNMTKKDYTLIAETLCRALLQVNSQHDMDLARTATIKAILVSYFTNALSQENYRFDADKFQTYIDEHCLV